VDIRMTRALVLGGTGMLGHVLWRTCREAGIEAVATVRADRLAGPAAAVLDPGSTLTGVRAEDTESVTRALGDSGAEVVVNCIGIVKQSSRADDAVGTIRVNSLFPHQLAAACRERGMRLIHVSTDCVFSGRTGGYDEDDVPDPVDLYGRSKLLGEVAGDDALTIRTSMIGRELEGANGLLEWFLGQAGGAVRGFSRAVFSGPTTPVLSRAIAGVIGGHPGLEGVHHLGADPIDKHELLLMLREAFSLDVEIERDDTVQVDRSLDSSRFRAATGWEPPSWERMVAELASTAAEYSSIKGSLASR
jgi:dTDP-4-dehydrorhamnose reductase